MMAWMIAMMVVNTALIMALYSMVRRRISDDTILAEVTEERRLLSQMQENFRKEYKDSRSQLVDIQKKVTRLAAEVEQEVKMSGPVISENVEKIVSDLSSKLNAPLEELAVKQGAVEQCLVRIKDERQRVNTCIKRGEKLLSFFNSQKSYEEIIKEWETSKVNNACALLSKGVSPSEVAEELGMSLPEVEMIKNVSV